MNISALYVLLCHTQYYENDLHAIPMKSFDSFIKSSRNIFTCFLNGETNQRRNHSCAPVYIPISVYHGRGYIDEACSYIVFHIKKAYRILFAICFTYIDAGSGLDVGILYIKHIVVYVGMVGAKWFFLQ